LASASVARLRSSANARAGAHSRRDRRAARPRSWSSVFGICACEPCSESRTRPWPKEWPKRTQHHAAARPSQSRLERVRSHHPLPAWVALAGPATSCQARKPAEPGAPTARGLTGWRGPGPLVKSRPTNSLLRRLPRTNSGIGRCPRHRCREPFQIERKALTKMSAVARNIDFVGVSDEAPASGLARVAVRVRIICCYASAIPQPICEAPAELFSCRPHRAPIVYSTLRYFPPPKSRIKHPRACGSSARRSLADASVSHCRTVVRPLQRMRLERDADDNRTALITPSNARFTDLGMFVSRLTFIQQWSYDRRCRTSHSCQIQTKQLQQTEQTYLITSPLRAGKCPWCIVSGCFLRSVMKRADRKHDFGCC
jgi:hypothetical protein